MLYHKLLNLYTYFLSKLYSCFLSNSLVFSHSGIKSLQLDFLNLDSWLRSPNYNNDNNALKANRGNYVNNNNVNNNNDSAADLPYCQKRAPK